MAAASRSGFVRGQPSGRFVPPYRLPRPGEAIPILGSRLQDAGIMPEGWSFGADFNRTLWNAYGSGVMVDDYSAAGAFVWAGTGGHAVSDLIDPTGFDYATGRWFRNRNANGAPNRRGGWPHTELSGFPHQEIPDVKGEVPAPPHTYNHVVAIPGMGERGTLVHVLGRAIAISSQMRFSAHACDLASSTYSRVSRNLAHWDDFPKVRYTLRYMVEGIAHFDPVAKRIYRMAYGFHGDGGFLYLDTADWRYKVVDVPPPRQNLIADTVQASDLDSARRAIVNVQWERIGILDLEQPGAGWAIRTAETKLPTSGGTHNRLHYDEVDDCWYTVRCEPNQRPTLWRISPPEGARTAAELKAGNWSIRQCAIGGAGLPTWKGGAGGAKPHNVFHRVAKLGPHLFGFVGWGADEVWLVNTEGL